MRRSAILLALLAALAGTPLRQSEAAGDHARSLAPSSRAADFEAADGGVGDDSEVGTLAASPDQARALGADVVLFHLPPPASSLASPAFEAGLRERVWWPQTPPALRLAWLQAFRF